MIREQNLLKPMRFRFVVEEDAKRYGDGWYVYDETMLVRMPPREQIKIEQELRRVLGLNLVDVMNGCRNDDVAGSLAATWIAIRRVDPDTAGGLDDYSPVVMLIDWEAVPDGEAVDSDPLDLPPSTDGETPASSE